MEEESVYVRLYHSLLGQFGIIVTVGIRNNRKNRFTRGCIRRD
jgi:hypothetical protein